jgi:hypothetical protein
VTLLVVQPIKAAKITPKANILNFIIGAKLTELTAAAKKGLERITNLNIGKN